MKNFIKKIIDKYISPAVLSSLQKNQTFSSLYELMKDNKFKVDNQYYEIDENTVNDLDCELEDISFNYEISKKNKKCVTFNNKVVIKD